MSNSNISSIENQEQLSSARLGLKNSLNFVSNLNDNRKGINKKLEKQIIVGQNNCEDVLKLIIELGGKTIIDNIISKQIPSNILNFVKELTEKLSNLQFQLADKEYFETINFPQDQEPSKIEGDTWMRGYVLGNKQNKICKNNNNINIQNTLQRQNSNQSKLSKNSSSHRLKSIKINKQQQNLQQQQQQEKQKYVSHLQLEPIDLSEPNFVNPIEEKLRQEKDKQIKQREEILKKEHDRQEKQIEIQNNLQKQIKESKAKQFTYNYDGNIIMIKNLKSEKMPPQSYIINYEVTEDKQVKKQFKGYGIKSQQKLKQVKKELGQDYMNYNNEERGEQINGLGSNVEQIILQQGCSIKQEGKNRIKVANKPVKNINNNFMDKNLRMSRTDYYNFSKTINNLGIKDDFQQFHQTKTDFYEPNKEDFKPSLKIKSANKKKGYKDNENIIYINSNQIYQTMTQNMEDNNDQYQNNIQEIMMIKNKMKYENTCYDEFNININKLTDWGKNIKYSTTTQLPKVKTNLKPTENDIKQTIGNKKHTQRTRIKVTEHNAFHFNKLHSPSTYNLGSKGIIIDQTAVDFGNISQIDKVAF